MIRKRIKDDTFKKIREDVIQNIKGVNKYLTDDILDDMDFEQLLNNCHPIEREDFQERFNQIQEREEKCKK